MRNISSKQQKYIENIAWKPNLLSEFLANLKACRLSWSFALHFLFTFIAIYPGQALKLLKLILLELYFL
jgi:hypothetical protein